MKIKTKLIILALGLAALSGDVFSQGFPLPVWDPLAIFKMAEKFKAEIEQWSKQAKQFANQKNFWKEELAQFAKLEEQWKKDETLNQKMEEFARNNDIIWTQLVGGVSEDFNWELMRLPQIEEIINMGFVASTGPDPYNAIFVKGGKIEDIFPGLRDWSDVKSSEKYQKNKEYQTYINGMIDAQNKMIADLENKIQLLAKINSLVPEREKKFQEIQMRLEEYAKQNVINLPRFYAINGEISLELSREMFHLVVLNRIEAENLMLEELRQMNSNKTTEKYQTTNVGADQAAVMKLFGEGESK